MTETGTASAKGNVLILTVGTGTIDDLEASLFQPLEKSLRDGQWSEAVLLPSKLTNDNARQFSERVQGRTTPIRIEPLPEAGQEEDPDACFGHFDHVLTRLREQGYKPESITPDFTRGTKAMSAALVLAAIRHGIPRLRYIGSTERDHRGTVIPGTEKIRDVMTLHATIRRRLDDAKQLICNGAFAAVVQLLPDLGGTQMASLVPKEFHDEISRLRRLAEFWSAWDRFDYKTAARCAGALHENDKNALKDELDILQSLAKGPKQERHADMARWLRAIANDLWRDGYRHIHRQRFEDALLRGYRVLELIGQARLFDHGHDSDRIDPDDLKVEEFRQDQRKNNKPDFGRRKQDGREVLTAAKELTARFLQHLGDPLAKDLLDFDKGGKHSLKVKDRNNSILTHGFSVVDIDESSLNKLYNRIRSLLDKDCPDGTRGVPTKRFGIVPD